MKNMKRHVFRISEQTNTNLVTESSAAGASKSNLIREKLVMAAKYVNEFDFDRCIHQDRIDDLRNELAKRKAAGEPIDDVAEELLNALDEQSAHIKNFEEAFNQDNDPKKRQVAILLSPEDEDRLNKLSKRFKVSKCDVMTTVINHDWND